MQVKAISVDASQILSNSFVYPCAQKVSPASPPSLCKPRRKVRSKSGSSCCEGKRIEIIKVRPHGWRDLTKISLGSTVSPRSHFVPRISSLHIFTPFYSLYLVSQSWKPPQ